MKFRNKQIKRCACALSARYRKEVRRILFFGIAVPLLVLFLPYLFWWVPFFGRIFLVFLPLQGVYLLFFCHPLWMGVRRWFLEQASGCFLHRSTFAAFFSGGRLYGKAVLAGILMALFRSLAAFLLLLPGSFAFLTALTARSFGGVVTVLSPLCFLAAAGLTLCGWLMFRRFSRRLRMLFWLLAAFPDEGFFSLIRQCKTAFSLAQQKGLYLPALFFSRALVLCSNLSAPHPFPYQNRFSAKSTPNGLLRNTGA